MKPNTPTHGVTLYADPAVYLDIAKVAADIRPEDADEILASSGLGALQGLEACFLGSTEVFAVREAGSGLPVALFGYVTETWDTRVGRVWMLGTNRLALNRWTFLKGSRLWCDYIQTKHDLLYNLIDQRNTVHIKWLNWLGFKFVRVIPEHGYLNLPFVEFVRVNNV